MSSDPTRSAGGSSRLEGLVAAIALLAVTVYSLVAVAMDLPPGSWVIDLEVRYSFDGRYGMVEAWAVTWFHLLALLVLPLALVALAGLRADVTPALEGRAAQARAALRRRRAPIGLAVSVVTVAFYACLALAPQALEPIGFVARLALVIAPFACFLGPASVLDALLAPAQVRVKVLSLDEVPGQPTYRHINGRYAIATSELGSLRAGSEVSMITTRVFGTVVSVIALDPYR